MKTIQKCVVIATTKLILATTLLSSLPVFAATDQTTPKSDTTVVNGGIDTKTELQTYSDIYQILGQKSTSIATANKRSKPSQVILRIPFQTQINDYYCGPASAAMVVNTLGYRKTQHEMARLLGTTRNGTNAGNGVANALNAVVRGSRFQFRWEWHDYRQIEKMRGHIVEALSYGNPVMVNTAESPGDVYLRGHNIGVPLYHFGVIGDYFNNGYEVTYTDPGYGRYRTFVQDQRVSIRNMSYATGTRGYVW